MTRSPASSFARLPWCAVLLGCLAAGCGSLRTARVVALGDVRAEESIWRPEGEPPEPTFVDTTHWVYRKLITSLSFEPGVESYVRDVLEEALGEPVDEVRVEYLGYRYAYYFPSRHDDFVLRVQVESHAAGVSGEFKGVVHGDKLSRAHELFGVEWEEDIPDTAPDTGDAEQTVEQTLEHWADRRAYLHRLALRLATERLTLNVLASRG